MRVHIDTEGKGLATALGRAEVAVDGLIVGTIELQQVTVELRDKEPWEAQLRQLLGKGETKQKKRIIVTATVDLEEMAKEGARR